MYNKRKIIVVTDGDRCAQRTIEKAVKNIGGRCISQSGGNPTPLSAEKIIALIKEAVHDPVVVMTDDEGNENTGIGEKVIKTLMNHPDIEVLGVIAVASNTKDVDGVHVDFSIDALGKITKKPVDKDGIETEKEVLYGDTVDVLEKGPKPPVIIGIGDIGKMQGKDDWRIGAPIITKALNEIMKQSH
ncbi:stage V sporulation protein AE [Alkaliphilus serpentinus]|uniref:Stage V sporulation protein AE n=1 Tax=Alkaliphilus serpentinus TaxID=1482731 RepID=A0A833MA50_9FIRM|nr:stage V sporulation protein AE [Alkaliphilus serpentinus]KAB3531475.1 stage V sporulation protein AE [Alkaliphilus serpentinus]